MKQYIVLIFSLLVGFQTSAQKYKDVYESIKNLSDDDAYQQLREYSTIKNNSHSASLYKMALILERRIEKYDPFLQERPVNQNIYNAELYLSLAKLNFDEKVARQDGRYFDDVVPANPKKDPNYQEINDAIDGHIKKIKAFKNVFVENRNNLYSAATKYNECIRIYNEINKKNSKLKDLYFLVDDNFEKQLNALKINFDSTLYYLDKLKKSLKARPMHNYTFEYHLNPIVIYRMHGLTPANFLAPTIELWDFDLWIKTFNDVYSNEITYLYKSIDEAETQNCKYVSALEKKQIDNVPENYHVSPYLINKIYKYDYESLANSLLLYQESQIRYMYQLESYRSDTSLFAMGVNYPAMNHFTKALEYRRATDSLLVSFNDNISAEGIKKYSNIFEKKYKGEKELKEYTKNEQVFNNKTFETAVNNFADRLLAMGSWQSGNSQKLKYNGDMLYAQIVPSEKFHDKGYFVHCKQVTDKNNILVGGTYVDKSGGQTAFVASIDTLRNIKWLKTFKPGEGSRSCMLVSAANNEIAAVVTSVSKAGAVRNFVILLDIAGVQKLTAEIKTKAIPRKLVADDISGKYIVVFSGASRQQFANEECDMHICCLDSKLKTEWSKQLKFKGYFSNILRTDNIYYIVGAFSKMHKLNNEDVDLGSGSGMFCYSIGSDGNWLKGENYELNKSIYPMWISKCDNTTFEVVSALDKAPENNPVKAAYMRFTFDGKETYSSIGK